MRKFSFSKLSIITKKAIAVICSLSVLLSVVTVVPFIAKADSPDKMFIIKPTTRDSSENYKYANVFIPLNFREVEAAKVGSFNYFKLTFKARNFSEGRPIVGVVRAAGGGTGGSFSEQYYTYNYKATDAASDSYLSCSYDPSTYTYTYIIKMDLSGWVTSSPEKLHSAITIGNAEHNGGWYNEGSPEAYFAFAYPELYSYDVTTGEEKGENLIAPINDDTVNLDKVYTHKTGNPYNGSDSMLVAPANKWGIDTTSSLIEYKDIPKDYFDPSKHNYIKHEAVEPTETEPGNKEYYTCDCEDCEGKYFTNKGGTEVKYKDIEIQPNGPEKAIIIKPNVKGDHYPSGVFIPLDFSKSDVKSGAAKFILKFKTRLVDGKMPIVGVVRNASKTGGSYSEPNYSYNNQGTSADTKLKAEYDEKTMTFSAVITVDLNDIYLNSTTGSYAAITIGKAEHNGNWYGENSFDSSFIIYEPELYRANSRTGKPANNINLIAGIHNNSVDLENSYTHRKNPYTSSDNLMSAPVDIWSVDGPTRYVTVADVPEGYFDTEKHNYVRHEAVEPTETEEGNIEYYTCECEDCKDKYFTNFGLTEIEGDVKIQPNGPEQMIVIGANNSGKTSFANVFVPLDQMVEGDPIFDYQTHYYKLSFKTKLYGDGMPTVSVVAYDDSAKGVYSQPSFTYNNNEYYWSDKYPALSAEYDPETMTYTAIIAMQTGYYFSSSKSGAHNAILIGNAEHNGNWYHERDFEASFSIYEPELYLYDEKTGTTIGDNMLPGINNNTLNLNGVYNHKINPYTEADNIIDAPLGKWSVDATKRLVSSYDVEDSYFDSSADNKAMLKVTGGKSDALLTTKATLKTTTSYKVDFDYVIEGDATVKGKLYAINGNGEMVELENTGAKILKPDDNLEGAHFSRIITMPTSGINTAGDNFKLVIGVESKEDDAIAYIGNVTVRSMAATGELGNNVLINGDFNFAAFGEVEPGLHLASWEVAEESAYKALETMEIPSDMFIDTAPNALYVDGAVGTVTTFASVTSGKTYLFRYKSKYNSSKTAEPYIEFLTNSGSSIYKLDYMRDRDGYYNTVGEFTAIKGLVSGKNVRVGIKSSFKDVDAVISGFELYELDKDGKIVGKNLISDSTFIKTNELIDYSKDADMGVWMKDLQNGDVEIKPVEITFFNSAPPQMLLFVGTNANGGGAKIEQDIALEPDKKYQLSLNVRYADVGVEGNKLGVELQYKKNGVLNAIESEKTESDTEYFETYTFTMPSDAAKGKNFNLAFHFSSAYTSGYVSNFKLYELDEKGEIVGENLVQNGDFSTGNAAYWTKTGYFYRYEFNEIPENLFSKVKEVKRNMIIYRNTSDYAQITYSPNLKAGTNYEIRYQELHTDYLKDACSLVALWQFYYNEKGEVENNSITGRTKVKDGTFTSEFFRTKDELYTAGNNNIIIRLYMRAGSAGYFGALELYELDEKGNRVSNNLIVNSDYSSGLKCWEQAGDMTVRVVEEPEGFFGSYEKPTKMVYSDGSETNATYGQTLKLNPDIKHYFSGFSVNMNSAGVKPQIQYLPRSAAGTNNYKDIEIETFYDTDRYFFEVEFEIPDDALIVDGKASVRVQMTNGDNGKGYFTELMLTEEGKYINLFDNLKASSKKNYQKVPYDAGVFVFYYDDSKFDNGDWSGEWENNKYNIKTGNVSGRILYDDGSIASGVKVQLDPGKITTTTDEYGYYSFEGIEPGDYKLYIIEEDGSKVYCAKVTVKKSISSMLSLITYTAGRTVVIGDDQVSDNSMQDNTNDFGSLTPDFMLPVVDDTSNNQEDILDPNDSANYGILRGFYYTTKGKTISGATIHLRNHGSSVTDESGMFIFENIVPGEYELYVVLADGSESVLRTVTIEANKGVQVKVMEPKIKEESDFPWTIIIIAVSAFLLADAALVIILILKKRKTVKI